MIPKFKIRASAAHLIMGGAVGKPTVKQLARIAELKAKEKLTPIQSEELKTLIAKRDAKPEIQQGAKTYCESWLKERLYGRRVEFSTKYTEKGNMCEPAAIDMVAERMRYGMLSKNEEHFEDEYFTGTPDVLTAEMIEEIKNSWSCFTFPLFATECPNKDYIYQVNVYMHLADKKAAAVNYCLIDAPEELIDREARNVSYKAGFNEVEIELYDEVQAKMTYSDIPDELKMKRFTFTYDAEMIKVLQVQVLLRRQYIAKLYASLYPEQINTI